MTPFVGQIMETPYNFAPLGWAFCDGQLLPISEYDTLFALIGTTYGGDGQSTFALPDLRGRTAIHPGQGSGLPAVSWGERAGAPTTTLLLGNIPSHNHPIQASSADGTQSDPSGAFPANANVVAERGKIEAYQHDLSYKWFHFYICLNIKRKIKREILQFLLTSRP